MAYPYDRYGDLSDDGYNELWHKMEEFSDEYGDWDKAREALFEWAHDTYPDIEDRDLWDVFRDYYASVTT